MPEKYFVIFKKKVKKIVTVFVKFDILNSYSQGIS